MDRLEAMQIFVTAVEEGSLSAASRRLHMPLATVSRKLSDLEEHLKTRLLMRSTRQLTLTDAGHEYLVSCQEILGQVAEAERTAAGAYLTATGQLVVTAPMVFGRLHGVPVVSEFVENYPEVDVRLLLLDHWVNLLEERVDIALRIGVLPDSSLVATPLGSVRRIICASPNYLSRFGTPLEPVDLRKHRCVTFEDQASPTEWVFPSQDGIQRIQVRSRISVNTAQAAIDAALNGSGLTRVLSYQAERYIKAGSLIRVLQGHEPDAIPVSLVHVGGRHIPMKSRAFIDFAVPRIRTRISM